MAMKEQIRKLVERLVTIQPIFGLLLLNFLRPSRFFYKMKKRRLVYLRQEKNLEVVYDAKKGIDFDKVAQSLLTHGAVVLQNL